MNHDRLPQPQESEFDMDAFMDQPITGPTPGSTTITGDLEISGTTYCRDEYITRGEVDDMIDDADWAFIKGIIAGLALASFGCFVGVAIFMSHNPWG